MFWTGEIQLVLLYKFIVDIIIVQLFLLLFSAAEHWRAYSEPEVMGIFFCDDGVHVTDGTGVSNYPTTLIFYKKIKDSANFVFWGSRKLTYTDVP